VSVVVNVERLVLDGVDVRVADRPKVQAAVEAELARLLAERGLGAELGGGGATPRLAGGTVRLGAGGPAGLGRGIAAAAHEGLAR
jgi:hypothetical protein